MTSDSEAVRSLLPKKLVQRFELPDPFPLVWRVGLGSMFLAKLSTSRWLIIEVAQMYCASGIKPAAHTWSPSSMSKGRSDAGGLSVEASSSAVVGKGLVRQAFILASSFFRAFLSSLVQFQHPLQHLGKHQDISTLPVFQSTSRLWSCNQVCPKIRFWLPRPVTQNHKIGLFQSVRCTAE